MTSVVPGDRVRRMRLRAQQLVPRRPDSPGSVAQVVKRLCGLPAQDPSAPALAVRARCSGLVAADVERARVQERSTVRTWCMRGTLHVLATEDINWLLPLLGPIFVRSDERRRLELGLDEDTCVRGMRVMQEALSGRGPLTRAELVDELGIRGIRLVGQAAPHLIARAALQSLICLGPDRGTKPTYVLLEDWIGRAPAPSREAGLAELARRYLGAYGPAGPDDLAAWSGLPIGEARRACGLISRQLAEVEVAGRPAWTLVERGGGRDEEAFSPPTVRLIPGFDPYLLGYRTRELVVAPRYAKRINPGGGLLHPTLLVDGWAVGTWAIGRHGDRITVTVEPFEALAPEVSAALASEIADLGRFHGVKAALSLVPRS